MISIQLAILPTLSTGVSFIAYVAFVCGCILTAAFVTLQMAPQAAGSGMKTSLLSRFFENGTLKINICLIRFETRKLFFLYYFV